MKRDAPTGSIEWADYLPIASDIESLTAALGDLDVLLHEQTRDYDDRSVVNVDAKGIALDLMAELKKKLEQLP